jgi:uncharacterized membrane protein
MATGPPTIAANVSIDVRCGRKPAKRMRGPTIYEHHRDDDRQPLGKRNETRLARGLGWFSIGLGVSQLVAPNIVARTIGIRANKRSRTAMFIVGLREIASGIGLLSTRKPASWARLRLGGDIIDLALLSSAFRTRRVTEDSARTTAAVTAVAGVMLIDMLAAARGEDQDVGAGPLRRKRAQTVTTAITIGAEPEDVYQFWRNFQNLPRFMTNISSIDVMDNRRSHWTVRGPAGTQVEWDAEIVEDEPNERISWRTLPGAKIDHTGSVRFVAAPGNRGTEVHVRLRYRASKFGASIAKLLFAEPGQQIRADLRRLKQVLETGSVVHSDSTVHGGPHPARPSEDREFPGERQSEVRT